MADLTRRVSVGFVMQGTSEWLVVGEDTETASFEHVSEALNDQVLPQAVRGRRYCIGTRLL